MASNVYLNLILTIAVSIAAVFVIIILGVPQAALNSHGQDEDRKLLHEHAMLDPKILPGVFLGWFLTGVLWWVAEVLYFRKQAFPFVEMRVDRYGRHCSPERRMHYALVLFVGMFGIGALLTKMYADFDPSNTELVKWYGYNNICIVFDFPPCTYVMSIIFILVAHNYLSYLEMSIRRIHNLNAIGVLSKSKMYVCQKFVWSLGTGVVLFALCLAVNPKTDMLGHTIGFLAVLYAFPFMLFAYYITKAAVLSDQGNDYQTLDQDSENKESSWGDKLWPYFLPFTSSFTIVFWGKAVCSTYALFFGYGAPMSKEVAAPLDKLFLLMFFASPVFTNTIRHPLLEKSGALTEAGRAKKNQLRG